MVVRPREFRTLDVNANLLRPLVGRGCQIWGRPGRSARQGKLRQNGRLCGALSTLRVGALFPNGLGPGCYPPGSRKAGFREIMKALRYPGQVGYPPSVATDP